MIVGICRITLLISESHSLKERRMVLRRIKDRVRNKFNVAIAEVSAGDYADSWQSAQLGFAVVSNDKGFTQSVVQKVLDYVDSLGMAKLADDEQDYISYGDERAGESLESMAHWEPDFGSDDDGDAGAADDARRDDAPDEGKR